MAITIKELLAADTISQAADKINFNFDQLLLNGGGPVGPPGPLGPPGPIGGRGIRGTQWFEGPTLPTITLNLEPNDYYLQGDISTAPVGDGDVYNFNGTSWIFTGINLTGPTGSMGISADWDVFGDPILTMGDCLYPNEALPPSKAALNDVRSAMIGGIPAAKTALITDYVIDDAQAELMNSSDSSLYIHVPQGDQFTGGVASIKFSGGDQFQDYEQSIVNNLAAIRLLPDDLLSIEDSKISMSSQYGLRFYSNERSEIHQIGRGFILQTGIYSGPSGAAPSNGNITLQITKDPTGFANSEITLEKIAGSNTASFKVGTSSSTSVGAPSGNIWSNAAEIFQFGQTGITSTVGASILNLDAVSINLTNTTGTINLDSNTMNSSSSAVTDITAGTDLLLNCTNIVPGTGIKLDSASMISLEAVGTIILESTGAGSGVGINTGLPATYPISPDLAVGGNPGNDGRVAIGPNSVTAGSMPFGGSLWVESSAGIGNRFSPLVLGYPHNNHALTVAANSVTDAATQRGALYVGMDNTYTGNSTTFAIKTLNYSVPINATKYGLDLSMSNANVTPRTAPGYGIHSSVLDRTSSSLYGIRQSVQNQSTSGDDLYGISQTVTNNSPGNNGIAGIDNNLVSNADFSGGRMALRSSIIGTGAPGSSTAYYGTSNTVTGLGSTGRNTAFYGVVNGGATTVSTSQNFGIVMDADVNYLRGTLNIGPTVGQNSTASLLRLGNGIDGYAAQIINSTSITGSGGGLYINSTGAASATNNYPLIIYADQYPDAAGTYVAGSPLGHNSLITCRTDGSVWLGGNNGGSVSIPFLGTVALSQVMVRFGNNFRQLAIGPMSGSPSGGDVGAGALPSDRKWKKNTVSLDSSILPSLMSLNPLTYEWNDEYKEPMLAFGLPVRPEEEGEELDSFLEYERKAAAKLEETQLGFIAQEVEEVLPHIVTVGEDNTKGLDYQKMVVYLTKGIQEQQKMIEDLQKQVKELQEKS